MTTITPAQLAEWEALADAATPGPWLYPTGLANEGEVELDTGVIWAGGAETLAEFRRWAQNPLGIDFPDATAVAGAIDEPDAVFIAAAREAVPALIAALQDTHARLDAVVEAVETVHRSLVTEPFCVTCFEDHPCATVRAIRKAAGR